MMNDTIEIRCPKCGGVHKYGLEIDVLMFVAVIPVFERIFRRIVDPIVERIIQALSKPKSNTKPKQFTRLFTCPVKHEDFQVVFVEDENSGNLRQIEIVGTRKGKRRENER